jgi:hypothetical protein
MSDYRVCGFRDDMWDVEQWQKRNAVRPVSYSDFLKETVLWMNGEGPSPYVEDTAEQSPAA